MRPAVNVTDVRVIAFADEPDVRVLRSYTPGGRATNAPPALYATVAPTGTSVPVVWFLANSVIAVEFGLAFTNRTYAAEKSCAGMNGSSITNASTFLLVAS